jgi:AraC family ethanolamine operon transcriptional activator
VTSDSFGPPPRDPVPFTRRRFVDSDEAAAGISNTNLQFSLLSRSERAWVLAEARVPGVAIFWGEHGAATAATGCTGDSIHSFFIPMHGADHWSLNGRPMEPGMVGYLGPGADHVVTMRRPANWLLLHVDVELLDPLLDSRGFAARLRQAPVAAFDSQPHAFAQLERRMQVALRFAEAHPELLESAGTADRLRAPLVSAALGSLPGETDSEPIRYELAASRIQRFLSLKGDDPVTGADICIALSISERTLRRYFREVYGSSPGRYLRNRRLHIARRSLRKRPHEGASVTQICTGLGFFDLGRFAADYREMFGERPSETLRQASGAMAQ